MRFGGTLAVTPDRALRLAILFDDTQTRIERLSVEPEFEDWAVCQRNLTLAKQLLADTARRLRNNDDRRA